MADFFGDLFDSITGQQATPQQTIIPTNEAFGQGFGVLNSTIAPGLVGFNQAMAPGITGVGLGVANQVDPSILANFRGANKSILDQLNLGGSLGQELQNDVITNALEGNAASGFGVGTGGRGLVARDLGLTSMDLLRRRQQDALGAGTSGVGVAKSFYDPANYTGLGAQLGMQAAGDIRNVQAAQDDLANLTENIRRQNFSSLLNTGGKIAGTVVGGIYGGAAGAQVGGQIGGSFIQGSGVAGQPARNSGGGGGFTSLLSGLGGMFGGQQAGGIGTGGTAPYYGGGEIASGTGFAAGRSV